MQFLSTLRTTAIELRDWLHWLAELLRLFDRSETTAVIKCVPGVDGLEYALEDTTQRNKSVTIVISSELLLTAHLSRPPLPWTRLNQLLTLDLKQRASFLMEACTVLAPDPQKDGTSAYWIIRNSTLAELRKQIASKGWSVRHVTIGEPYQSPLHPLQVRSLFALAANKARKALAQSLLICLILGTVAAPVILKIKMDRIESDLRVRIEAISPIAEKARLKFAAARSLQATRDRLDASLKQSVSAVGVLIKLTKILPLRVQVSDFELKNNMLSISGYSPKAAQLIEIFDRSVSFQNAAFTAPLEHNIEKDLDRFSISARVTNDD